MPAGVSWGQYLRFTTAAMLSMFAGSQFVHSIYRPMDDIDAYIKEELSKFEKNQQMEEVQVDQKDLA